VLRICRIPSHSQRWIENPDRPACQRTPTRPGKGGLRVLAESQLKIRYLHGVRTKVSQKYFDNGDRARTQVRTSGQDLSQKALKSQKIGRFGLWH
jgi:hypothetical protein